ncbi:hypothetical protein FA95DRAFT_584748 [Auriscalpium vulgare]|uniref:Uncharacterized protein n=1 Tax=Auriscalpium vulgare TaxID=40419 RepID=A0ACB8RDS6_9AGAM|nr:hypothetical protein FA95DRAFT_584748 [Auriscalpium vulgare]
MPFNMSQADIKTVDILGVLVARLPLEILAAIFYSLSFIALPGYRRRPGVGVGNVASRTKLGWLAVTHVCRRWRYVALQEPALWANIATPHPLGDRWANAFFTRAKESPLSVRQPDGMGPLTLRQSDREFIRANLARIRVLSIKFSLADPILDILCSPAPVLHALDLTLTRNRTTPDFTFALDLPFASAPAISLPDSFLRGAPLWHVRLPHVAGQLPWTSPLLANLVSLEFEINTTHAQKVALEDVLDALRRMPTLQRLAFSLALDLADPGAAGAVALPQLRHLQLRADIESAHRLIAHLVLPISADTQFAVHCHASALPAADTAAFFSAMTASFAGVPPLAHIRITRTVATGGGRVSGWRAGPAHSGAALDVALSDRTQLSMTAAALAALASEHLEELNVYSADSDPAWLVALGRAPRLRDVAVDGPAVRAFCAALDDARFLPALSALLIAGPSSVVGAEVLADVLPQSLARRPRRERARETECGGMRGGRGVRAHAAGGRAGDRGQLALRMELMVYRWFIWENASSACLHPIWG